MIGDSFEDSIKHRFLLFGDSGTGKTAAVCLAEADLDLDLDSDNFLDGITKPVGDRGIFLLACEANALVTARLVNPSIQHILCTTKNAVIEVMKAAGSGELEQQGVHTLAIDGGTEVQRLLKDAHVGQDVNNSASDKFDWQLFNETVRRFMRTVRSLPLDVVMTALVRVRENDETKQQEVMPSFEGGKTPGEAAQYFAACGYASRLQRHDGTVQHVVQFSGLPNRYKIKAAGPLRGAVRPCVQAWKAVLDKRMDRHRIVIPDVVLQTASVAPADPGAPAADPAAPTTVRSGRPGRAAAAG